MPQRESRESVPNVRAVSGLNVRPVQVPSEPNGGAFDKPFRADAFTVAGETERGFVPSKDVSGALAI
ncbi:hypothetical protein X740_15535 [Mesorhizobium sp. LNHC221B00]|uniref:hypothetical protein n=1 Tax=Mesorhizobium sp. LNHC221B00 TaxID=1287233 RepID=UPI0003CDE639|nr:hypothetical protein [Mesorhizobium sp. LNHC221B00]ESY79812.1 hypothetical protein X740_15535 [Mesorhizobium sp. LNHC221B00]